MFESLFGVMDFIGFSGATSPHKAPSAEVKPKVGRKKGGKNSSHRLYAEVHQIKYLLSIKIPMTDIAKLLCVSRQVLCYFISKNKNIFIKE